MLQAFFFCVERDGHITPASVWVAQAQLHLYGNIARSQCVTFPLYVRVYSYQKNIRS